MTEAQLKENIEDNTDRLKRQYELCLLGYNRPALKDLAHILRVWMDMREEVANYLVIHNPKVRFTSFAIGSRFNRTFRNRGYLASVFPEGVTIAAIQEKNEAGGFQTCMFSMDVRNLNVSNMKISINVEILPNEVYRVEHTLAVWNQERYITFTEDESKIVESPRFEYKKVLFNSWLDSAAVRMNIHDENSNLILHDISREIIIRRVANILGGSHPEGGIELIHPKDELIRELMNYKAIGIPLPYFILLKIAADILQAFK